MIQSFIAAKIRISKKPNKKKIIVTTGLFIRLASGSNVPPPMYRKLPARKDNTTTRRYFWIEKKKVVLAPRTGATASMNNILKEDFRLIPELSIRAKALMPSQKS